MRSDSWGFSPWLGEVPIRRCFQFGDQVHEAVPLVGRHHQRRFPFAGSVPSGSGVVRSSGQALIAWVLVVG